VTIRDIFVLSTLAIGWHRFTLLTELSCFVKRQVH